MSASQKLTPRQQALLEYLGDEILHRFAGGCWAKNTEQKNVAGYPMRYVGTPTVRALLKQGRLKVVSEAPWGPVSVRAVRS